MPWRELRISEVEPWSAWPSRLYLLLIHRGWLAPEAKVMRVHVPLRVGSLFSGIGGFDLGLERAGMRVAWQCEQDEFCQRVLAKHWPEVPCYSDVRELDATSVAPVDVLCGGFPCQDLSVAGRGAGLDGERSGLYAEVMRLLGELRPRYLILENVAAIRSRGLGRVLGEMAALGYDAEWDCIPASAVGAHHQRDRWWLIAYPQRPMADAKPPRLEGHGSITGQPEICQPRDGGASSRDVADTDILTELDETRADTRELTRQGAGWRGERDGSGRGAAARPPLTQVGGVVDGIPVGLDGRWLEPDVPRVGPKPPNWKERTSALGNALVPQIAERIGRGIVAHERTATPEFSTLANAA